MPGEGRGNRTNHPGTFHGHSIESLRLDIETASGGRTWHLLPEGFRNQQAAKTYPLPTRKAELQRIIAIPTNGSTNSGCVYIRRAIRKLKELDSRRQSAVLDIESRVETVKRMKDEAKARIWEAKKEAQDAARQVKLEAEKAIAGLNELFDLGKKGMEAQMRAYIDNKEYQGEKINARAFRECFRMVTQAVKGFGIPSGAPAEARETIMEEAAQALKDTQEAVALAVDSKTPETVN